MFIISRPSPTTPRKKHPCSSSLATEACPSLLDSHFLQSHGWGSVRLSCTYLAWSSRRRRHSYGHCSTPGRGMLMMAPWSRR